MTVGSTNTARTLVTTGASVVRKNTKLRQNAEALGWFEVPNVLNIPEASITTQQHEQREVTNRASNDVLNFEF